MRTLPYPMQPIRTGPLRHLLQLALEAWNLPFRRSASGPLSRPHLRSAVAAQPLPAPARRATAPGRRPDAATVVPSRSLPLRVVRVVDAESTGLPSVGRMRISGRMADVCAELDRLAEREAALLGSPLTA